MSDGEVKILDGNTFVVSDSRGDIEASPTDATGLFSYDTRFLSKWVLTVNGERLNALSVDDLQYFETRFFLVPGTGTVYIDAKLSVIRRRAVGDGFHEELTVLNHADQPVDAHGADRGRLRLRRPVRGQGRAEEEGQATPPGSRRAARARLRARDVPARDVGLGVDAGRRRRDRAHLRGSSSSRTGPGRRTSTSSRSAGNGGEIVAAARRRSRATEHGAGPRAVAGGGAAPRVRLGAAEGDLPAQPGRPGRAALLAVR